MATEEFGTVTFGKGGKVIPVGEESDTFQFPDEIESTDRKSKRLNSSHVSESSMPSSP